jgi:hypothetical protein
VIDIKRITIPVFLVYAGIIHAIGLALLLPMIVTLPGPGSMIAPDDAPVATGGDAVDRETTSALSAAPMPAQKEAAIESAPPPAETDIKADAPGNIANLMPTTPALEPDHAVETKAPAPKASNSAKTDDAKGVSSTRKPARQSAKPSARRSAKKGTKITPFGGAMSGLFTPGSSKRIFNGRN